MGQFGRRHFDTYVFAVDYPLFDASDPGHADLVGLVERAEAVAASVDLPEGTRFQTARKLVRQALAEDGVAGLIEERVSAIIG